MISRMRAAVAREQGMSLVETVFATSAAAIVLTGLVTLLTVTARWGDDVQEASVTQTEVRGALDELVREVRQAWSGDGTPAIELLSPTQITFRSPDRGTPMRLRRISYQLTGGRFERAIAVSTNTGAPPWTFGPRSAWVPQFRGVENAQPFTYLDESGLATTDPARVRTVTVTVVMPGGTGQGTRSTYSVSATLRASP